MKPQKNQKIIKLAFEFAGQKPRKAAIFFFAFMVMMGGTIIGIDQWRRPEVQTARVLEVQTGEYGTLPAWWLSDYFGASVCEVDECNYNSDPDRDKLTNGQEYYYRSNPTKEDTNGNGQNDGEDVAQNFDPSKPGRVTFEDAGSDDTIVGEGLAFEEDIVDAFNEEIDISKVPLQVVPDGLLDVVHEENVEIYTDYTNDLHSTIEKYFPRESMGELQVIMESGSDLDIAVYGRKALELSVDLKKIKVPAKFIAFHKYNIAFYQTLYELLSLNAAAGDLSNPEGDVWFDKAQSLYVLMQKLNFEKQRLLVR